MFARAVVFGLFQQQCTRSATLGALTLPPSFDHDHGGLLLGRLACAANSPAEGSYPEWLLEDHRRRATLPHRAYCTRDVEDLDRPVVTNALDRVHAAPARKLKIRDDEIRPAHLRLSNGFLFIHRDSEGRESEVTKAILNELRR